MMRDIVGEIARYLMDNGEENVFCDALPDKPDCAAAVYEYSSASSGIGEGAGARAAGAMGFMPRALHIRTRAKGRAGALEAAYRIFALLSSEPDERLIPLEGGGALIFPKQTPAMLERDARGRAVVFFNMTACG